MKFKKIYIEITNSCNFSCSFCFPFTRRRHFMTVDEFRIVCDKVKSYTNYIYLHVLGEPLLHPSFEQFLQIASEAGLFVNLTTNASLLSKYAEVLMRNPVRQINFSLHDAEENVAPENLDSYLQQIFDFTTRVSDKTYCCLRLWNEGNAGSTSFNNYCIEQITSYYRLHRERLEHETSGNGIKLAPHVFLQRSPRFEWPDARKEARVTQRSCYALRDHIAILAGGEIVPCCLDADAHMQLGSIFTDDLGEVLSTPKAQQIKDGFAQRRITEPLCATCGFVVD